MRKGLNTNEVFKKLALKLVPSLMLTNTCYTHAKKRDWCHLSSISCHDALVQGHRKRAYVAWLRKGFIVESIQLQGKKGKKSVAAWEVEWFVHSASLTGTFHTSDFSNGGSAVILHVHELNTHMSNRKKKGSERWWWKLGGVATLNLLWNQRLAYQFQPLVNTPCLLV